MVANKKIALLNIIRILEADNYKKLPHLRDELVTHMDKVYEDYLEQQGLEGYFIADVVPRLVVGFEDDMPC